MRYCPTLGRLFGWPEVVSEEGNIEVLFVLEEGQSPKVIELIKCRNDKNKKTETLKKNWDIKLTGQLIHNIS